VKRVCLASCGAVSPAGWGMGPFRDALAKGVLLPAQELPRPGLEKPLPVLRVSPPNPRPAFLAHARLRRTSPITQFAVAAALEAMGPREPSSMGELGIIVCVLSGCVNYSRRFYDETLKDPGTASPLVFPETVFNAPASHISAFLGSTAVNYTLVGDAGTFLQGLATGANWLLEGKVSECLVVGTEEIDWLTAEALRLFDRSKILSEGAGAVLLRQAGDDDTGVALDAITDEFLYSSGGKMKALTRMKEQLAGLSRADAALFDSTSGTRGISENEARLWADWPGLATSPKKILGEGLMASAAWQVLAAVDALAQGVSEQALVSIAGLHQHAIGASLSKDGGRLR
jgi:3-oxoacyl-(acyl-carrier-protein) synthase